MPTTFTGLQNALSNYVRQKTPKNGGGKAVIGTISGKSGNKVVVENKTYTVDFAADFFCSNGDRVCCLLPENGRVAAVVGAM